MIDKNIEVSRYFQKLGFTVSLLDEELTLPLHRFSEVEQAIQQELLKARINSLLDLEQWIKLHDLGQEMILDGIEHMVKSNLQVPDQPRINHDDRIADLQAKLMDTTRESE